MRKFLKEIGLFIIIGIVGMTMFVLTIRVAIDTYSNFSIDIESKNLILGNSRPMCAFNDELVDGFVNMAGSGESYFYTYYKLRQFLKKNKQIKNVFVDVDYIGFNEHSEEWLFRYGKYNKYHPIIDFSGIIFLIKNDYMNVVKTLVGTIDIVIERGYDVNNWGGYRNSKESVLWKDLENAQDNNQNLEREYISDNNVRYLQKIVEICHENNVKLYLVRMPFHRSANIHDTTFFWIKDKYFSDVEFIDFINLQFEDDEYMNANHLNSKGAEVFSVFFDRLIKDGWLDMDDKQEFVNKKILNRQAVE